MLGKIEGAQKRLSPASQEDLTIMGYTKQEEFISSAEDVLNKFIGRGGNWKCRHSSHGSIFAFQNEANKLDILIAKGAKLVYKTINITFLSNCGRVVLKSLDGVICVSNGKSVIVKR